MNTEKAINELRRILKNEGIDLYFGASYDTKRNTSERNVHLLPFAIQAEREGFCYYDATWNIRVFVKKELRTELRDNENGINSYLINEVTDLANTVISTINSSDQFLITQKINTIQYTYISGDMNASAATESSITFQIPVRLWQQN